MSIDELIHVLEGLRAAVDPNTDILKRHVLDDGTIVYNQINSIDVYTTSDYSKIVSL